MLMRWLYHPVVVLLLTLAGVVFSYSLYSNIAKTRSSTEHVSVLEQETYQIASDVSSLAEKLETAQTPENQEKIIRDQLLMQKTGETVVQLAPITASNSSTVAPKPSPQPAQEWKNLLFK